MNFEYIVEMCMELSLLPFFPPEPAARLALARMIGNICHNEEQVRWLITIMTNGNYEKWEGPSELRAVACMKFKPKDGIEAISKIYPDGMTREQLNPGVKLLPSKPLLELLPGEIISRDQEIKELVSICEEATKLPSVLAPPRKWTEMQSGESELQALIRISQRFAVRPEISASPASTAQIEAVKNAQEANLANQS